MCNIGISLYCRKIFFLASAAFVDICIIFNNMRQQHRISSSVRNMENSTQLMSHTVSNSKTCCIEGKSCQTGRYMHLLSCMHIITVNICTIKIYATDLDCFLCKCRCKLIMVDADIRLNCMSQNIHTCICCNRRRNTAYKLRIQNCLISGQAV